MKALLLALLAVSLCAAAEPDGKADTKTKGYNCLFLGHSFFAPIASQFGQHPARCGFSGHKQTIVMHGGQNGSPGYLWNCQTPDVIHARELLATGTVDLLGMTYFPGAGSDVPDYRHWIDLALRYNPKTEVFIQLPWPMFRGKTPADYESESAKGTVIIHQTIDRLRQTYPKTTFLFIPQGAEMVALWQLYDQGKLPEVKVLKLENNQDRRSCLFRDDIGHGGEIPVRMGALLWLAILYKVDLQTYQWPVPAQFDRLKALAQEIARKDPYCGLGTTGENKK